MFERSNILYVWIDDIAVNVFKFSAGVQRSGLDCKMLHSVFRTTLRTANMALIWGHGEKVSNVHKSTIVLCSCYWNVFLQPTVSIA